jgi:hypothetical protein
MATNLQPHPPTTHHPRPRMDAISEYMETTPGGCKHEIRQINEQLKVISDPAERLRLEGRITFLRSRQQRGIPPQLPRSCYWAVYWYPEQAEDL